MSAPVALKTQPRSAHGTNAAVRLRQQGLVPAVVYGHKQATASLAVPRDEFEKALRSGARAFQLESGDGSESAIIKDLQWDHLGKDILHIDFLRVDLNEKIVVLVAVELRGVAPGAGPEAVVDHELHNLHIECTAANRPERIRVDLTPLKEVGSVIHVSDLQLPEGLAAKDNPTAVVVQLKRPGLQSEVPGVGLGGGPEPEVLTRGKADKEGDAGDAKKPGGAKPAGGDKKPGGDKK